MHTVRCCANMHSSSQRTPETTVLNLFLHSAISKPIDIKGTTVVHKFNRNPKLKNRGGKKR